MSVYGWENCPPHIKDQINSLMEIVKTIPGIDLIGIYLHGSLAMGCFNPERSDIDMLVVTGKSMTVDAKRLIITHLLALSSNPCPIEISFLTKMNLSPWRFPTPFDLHYSEMWRQGNINDLENQAWRNWNEKVYTDPDLAAHITIILNRGICLYGSAANQVFPAIPEKDYRDSIMMDCRDARENMAQKPVYAVLTFCRVYCYLFEQKITSKQEGGLWGMEYLPAEFRQIIETSLAIYQGDIMETPLEEKTLQKFDEYINRKITSLLKF
jgi:streptomycin 3"-adenylyltransferase